MDIRIVGKKFRRDRFLQIAGLSDRNKSDGQKRGEPMKVGEKKEGVLALSFAIGRDEQTPGTTGKRQGAQGKTKSVQMGAGMQQNPIMQKKEAALRQARKVVADVFESDNKVALDMEKRRANIKTLKAESKAAGAELKKINDQKAAWKEEYGIEDDSQEQKDLQLLEKRQDSQVPGSGVILSGEERMRLAEIDGQGLTDYQKRCLEVNQDAGMYRSIIESSKKEIKAENTAIRDTKINILATPYEQGMGFAQDTAEDIKLAASKDAAYGMIGEVKDKVDEDWEKAQEKAEERKEEKEEKEEKLEERKEQEEAAEERVEGRREDKAGQEQMLERNREHLAGQKEEAESLREQIAAKTAEEKERSVEMAAAKPKNEDGINQKIGKSDDEDGTDQKIEKSNGEDDTGRNAGKAEKQDEKQNEKHSYKITELSQEQDDIQEKVKRKLNKLGLNGEDAKGVAVDELV